MAAIAAGDPVIILATVQLGHEEAVLPVTGDDILHRRRDFAFVGLQLIDERCNTRVIKRHGGGAEDDARSSCRVSVTSGRLPTTALEIGTIEVIAEADRRREINSFHARRTSLGRAAVAVGAIAIPAIAIPSIAIAISIPVAAIGGFRASSERYAQRKKGQKREGSKQRSGDLHFRDFMRSLWRSLGFRAEFGLMVLVTRAISGNLTIMKRVQTTLCLLFLSATACGGSSSETPMPLEPVPHAGPEPGSSPREKEAAQDPNAEDGAGVEPSAADGSSEVPPESTAE